MNKNINKPIIGISTNNNKIENKPFKDHERVYINKGYIDSVIKAGGIPLLLPLNADLDTADQLLSMVDGFILSGGQDVNPRLYGEENHPLLGEISGQRDTIEMHILKRITESKKPLLGICRGHQLINVFFGGTLYQDLSLQPKANLKHSQDGTWHELSHSVSIAPNSKLHQIFGILEMKINSFHHQAVKDLAPGFVINALSSDNVIESIAKTNGQWIVGVQWHPELMVDKDSTCNLFSTLVHESAKYKNKEAAHDHSR